MPWIEQARLLLRKAHQDADALKVLADDPDISDEIVGFHTQQACEKALKAVLAAQGTAYRHTHNLRELIDLIKTTDVYVPADVASMTEWTPFAAFFRYEDFLTPDPLDRAKAIDSVVKALEWAEPLVSAEESDASIEGSS